MHLHIMDIRFNGNAPTSNEIHELFKNEYGVAILWTAKGTKDVRDFAESTKFHFKDTNMLHIHANMTTSTGDTIQLMYSDDQTGIVIPENYMLLQAMLFQRDYKDALKTDRKIVQYGSKEKIARRTFFKKRLNYTFSILIFSGLLSRTFSTIIRSEPMTILSPSFGISRNRSCNKPLSDA